MLDLGAAPGGWTQVAVARVRSEPEKPSVIARRYSAACRRLQRRACFCSSISWHRRRRRKEIRDHIPKGGVDIVLSDMAPNTTGHAATDHIRIVALLEAAYPFACEVLKPGGVFVAKVFQGGAERELLMRMKQDFAVGQARQAQSQPRRFVGDVCGRERV